MSKMIENKKQNVEQNFVNMLKDVKNDKFVIEESEYDKMVNKLGSSDKWNNLLHRFGFKYSLNYCVGTCTILTNQECTFEEYFKKYWCVTSKNKVESTFADELRVMTEKAKQETKERFKQRLKHLCKLPEYVIKGYVIVSTENDVSEEAAEEIAEELGLRFEKGDFKSHWIYRWN